jgi:predicted MFS family arabinose efflux permease
MSPLVGRVADRWSPGIQYLITSSVCIAVYALQTAGPGLSVAMVIIICFAMDIFRQIQQVSIATRVLGLDHFTTARMSVVITIAVSISALPCSNDCVSY